MHLSKRHVPGSAPGGYTWTTAQDIVEVPDELALDLLSIRDAGFSEVAPPVENNEQDDSKDPAGTGPDADDDAEQAPKNRGGRPRKTPVAE